MGLHYPLGYVGYEVEFLKTFINLLDDFCTGCHTNDDVGDDCNLCPMGHLIITAKGYLLGSYGDSETMLQVKEEITSISPYPLFNTNWIFKDKRGPDRLLRLRELLKDLDFSRHNNIRFFNIEQNILSRLYERVKDEIHKEK